MSASFMGIDLHKRTCYFTEIDSEGKVLRRGRFGNNIEEVSAFAGTLSSEVGLVVEPVLNYLWFLDLVAPYVGSVHPANPSRVRLIAEARTKCDRYDALMLAELLRTNFLPVSYYVPREIRDLRDLIRQRGQLVSLRVTLKNRIRHLLFLNGSSVSAADISSAKAHREIGRLALPPVIGELIGQCLGTIGYLNGQIWELEEKLTASNKGEKERALLETIPGIGRLSAIIIYAESGDIGRFKSGRAFASYCGLVPRVHSSGDKTYLGPITKTGSTTLRRVFVEAAIAASRKSEGLSRLFQRVLYRSNVQKARVAVAHKLAQIAYAITTKGERFKDF